MFEVRQSWTIELRKDNSCKQVTLLLKCTDHNKLGYSSTGIFVILYIQYSEYVLYTCMRTQQSSPAGSEMTIIKWRLCISPADAVCQRGGPHMFHSPLLLHFVEQQRQTINKETPKHTKNLWHPW